MNPREDYDEEEWAERVERFADPGGTSALHPESSRNPRREPDRLTPADRRKGYQCDSCADAAERGGW